MSEVINLAGPHRDVCSPSAQTPSEIVNIRMVCKHGVEQTDNAAVCREYTNRTLSRLELNTDYLLFLPVILNSSNAVKFYTNEENFLNIFGKYGYRETSTDSAESEIQQNFCLGILFERKDSSGCASQHTRFLF